MGFSFTKFRHVLNGGRRSLLLLRLHYRRRRRRYHRWSRPGRGVSIVDFGSVRRRTEESDRRIDSRRRVSVRRRRY